MKIEKRGQLVEKQLGFRPECRCGCLGVVGYQAHPVDECGGSRDAPEAVLLCGACLEDELVKVQGILLDAFLGSRPAECKSCGLKLQMLSDVITRIQPLWVWPDDLDNGGQ